MEAPPLDVRAVAESHFRARYDAPDASKWLATLDPGFMLVSGRETSLAAVATPPVIAAVWASAEGPQLTNPVVGNWQAFGDDRGLLDVMVLDVREESPFETRLGLVRGPLGWRVAFAGVPSAPAPSFELARMSALAELASLRAMSAGGGLTSLLEVAWARLRRMPRVRLMALPETRFTCGGTGTCCTHDLTIGLDDPARLFVESVDWEALAPHHPVGPFVEALPAAAAPLVAFKHKLTRDARGRCKFLTPENRCAIHALAGHAVFKPCHVFPYRFAASPDGLCVTTHSMCPTARGCLGRTLAEQEPDLRSRLAVADVLRTEKFYMRAGEAVEWEVFKTVEGQILELLLGEAPIKRKLWVALRWLSARLKDDSAGVAVKWYDEPAARLGFVSRLAFKRYPSLFDLCFKDLKGVAQGEGIWPEHEAELTRFFRAHLFSKVATYPYGLVAGLNYAALVLVVLERQLKRHAKRGISEAFWQEFYAVVTSGTFAPILQVLHQRPATGFARHAGDPDFGLALLRLNDAVPGGRPPV